MAKKRLCLKCGEPITYSYSVWQQYCHNCWNKKMLKGGYEEEMVEKKKKVSTKKMETETKPEVKKEDKKIPKAKQVRQLLKEGIAKEEVAKKVGVKLSYVMAVEKKTK